MQVFLFLLLYKESTNVHRIKGVCIRINLTTFGEEARIGSVAVIMNNKAINSARGNGTSGEFNLSTVARRLDTADDKRHCARVTKDKSTCQRVWGIKVTEIMPLTSKERDTCLGRTFLRSRSLLPTARNSQQQG